MQPEQQDPNIMPNPEQEALLKVGMESKDSLDQVAMNTEVSALKSDEIASNTEATALAASRLQEPLEQIVENTKPVDVQKVSLQERKDEDDEHFNENEAGKALWSMLRGPKGYTPVKGKDYFTDEEIEDFKSTVTPVSGIDYFTDEEIEEFKKNVTPVKGFDYFDGEKGDKGDKGEKGDSIVGPRGPQGLAGKDGKPGRDGKDATQIDIVKIQKEIEEKLLKQANDKYEETASILTKKVASKTVSLRELDDVDLSGLSFIDGKYVLGSGGGGSLPPGGTTGQVLRKQSNADGDADWETVAGTGIVETIVAGTGITVDDTDPANPIVSATGGGGGITRSVSTISTPTTAGATALTDYVYFISNTTLTLPTAVSNTNRYTVKCLSGTCVVDGDGTETIDGTATIGIQVEDSVDLISNNTEWKVV
jgi:hypothetical protein